jgi:hypothetical protein
MRKATVPILLLLVCGSAAGLFAATPVSFLVYGNYLKGNKLASWFETMAAHQLRHEFPCARVLTASDAENLLSFERQRDLIGGRPAKFQ